MAIKRKLVPIKNSVLCRRVSERECVKSVGGIFQKVGNVDLYEILDFAKDDDIDFGFKTGDIVMSTSTGDEIEINQGEIVYLFKIEHIMCRVCDEN